MAVFAQDAAPPAPADVSPQVNGVITVVIGIAISWIVALLKKIPFVASNPKLTALGISILVSVITAVAGARGNQPIWGYAIWALLQLGGAIGTHEMLNRPVAEILTPAPDPSAPLSGR
jgi:hypothetical protein